MAFQGIFYEEGNERVLAEKSVLLPPEALDALIYDLENGDHTKDRLWPGEKGEQRYWLPHEGVIVRLTIKDSHRGVGVTAPSQMPFYKFARSYLYPYIVVDESDIVEVDFGQNQDLF